MNIEIPSSWKKTFFIIWAGQAFSLLGSELVQFSLVWYMTRETGSATVLATATFVGLLPYVFLAPFAGALVDRWDRKRVMILADAAIAIASLGLAILFWLGKEQLWHIYCILFIRSLGSNFHWPSMQASTTLLVPQKHLSRIAGINQSLRGALGILSPPFAALLLKLMPIQGILGIDILTALIAILPLLFVTIPQPSTEEKKPLKTPTDLWQDVKAGFSYMYNWKGMFILCIMASLINFLVNPAFTLLPLLVTGYFGGGVWKLSFIESSFGIGVIIGGLILSTWGGFKKKIYTTFMGVLGMGLGILMIAFAPSTDFYIAVAGVAITGLLNPIANGPIMAIMQSNVVPEMQGRVFTALSSLSSAMSPLGMLIAAPVAEIWGVRSWFVIGGASCVLMSVGGFIIPAVVDIEEERKQRVSKKLKKAREDV